MDRTVGYLVHNLNDPAVERRVGKLMRGRLAVRVAGFYRASAVTEIAGQPAAALQQTHDSRLAHRAGRVLANLVNTRKLQVALEPCQILLARNLEMLALAVRLRLPGQRLVYECLDIHRVMLRRDRLGTAMRWLERSLMAHCDAVITSSPAYEQRYFRSLQGYTGPVEVIENKLATAGLENAEGLREAVAPLPWKIGLFGMLRCARSLALFRRLVLTLPGQVEVHFAGIPAYSEMPDFDEVVASTPGLYFTGRYNADELPSLYANVHFAWCVDFFEAGLNSDWLLPNRLYESVACGCVPLGQLGVEVGTWLARNRVGRCLANPEAELADLIGGMTRQHYTDLKCQALSVPLGRVAETTADVGSLVKCLTGTAE